MLLTIIILRQKKQIHKFAGFYEHIFQIFHKILKWFWAFLIGLIPKLYKLKTLGFIRSSYSIHNKILLVS